MHDKATVEEFLISQGLSLAGELVADPENASSYYVFLETKTNSSGAHKPSRLKLRQISEHFASKNLDLKFILLAKEKMDLAATIKSALDHRFTERINNVFCSETHPKREIWIEPRQLLKPGEQNDIKSAIGELLIIIKQQNYDIKFTSQSNLPTPTACLSTIRKFAPVSEDEIYNHLTKRGFEIPNYAWLRRMLDRLRRSQRIMRIRENNSYVLTLNSLMIMGSKKTRHSPDVSRALDLARRDS